MKKIFICFFEFILLFLTVSCGSEGLAPKDHDKEKDTKSGSEIPDNAENNIQDVIFLNDLLDIGYDAVALQANILQDAYYEPTNNEQLYAFSIRLMQYYDDELKLDYPKDYPNSFEYESTAEFFSELYEYKAKTAARLAKNVGLLVLSDYPYGFYNQPHMISKCSDADNADIDKLVVGDCVVAGTLEQMEKLFDNTGSVEGWFCIVEPAPRPDFLDILKEAGLEKTDHYVTSSGWYRENRELVRTLLGDENQLVMKVNVE